MTTTHKIVAVLILLAAGLAVGRWSAPAATVPAEADGGGAAAEIAPPAAAAPEIWTCSMHPQVRLPGPGQCPICAMDLIRLDDGATSAGPRTLELSENAIALAEIETALVERGIVERRLRLVGKVALDETRVATISAWVPGRIERLYVDSTGIPVRAGDHLLELYSPKLFAAQTELLQALASAKRLRDSSVPSLRATADDTLVSAREKLRFLGVDAERIRAIEASGAGDPMVTVTAPIGGIVVHKDALQGQYVQEGTRLYTIADLSRVWLRLDAYESDLAWLRYGEDVEFEVEAYPGEQFHGRVSLINPVLDDRTRTVKVRVDVANTDQRLKPDMFVRATVLAPLSSGGRVIAPDLVGKYLCPMHPEVVADHAGECEVCGMQLVPAAELGFAASDEESGALTIPASAPLVTGKRAVVYVRAPGLEAPRFEGREVLLGPRFGDRWLVLEGLEEGERVVARGAFKIDSELQIQARPSMMNPGGGGAAIGHQHGAAPPQPASDGGAVRSDAPAAFRAQLGAFAEAYLVLQAALAADDSIAARAAAAGVVAALRSVAMDQLAGDAHMRWMALQAPLRVAAERSAEAGSLDEQRAAFEPLGHATIAALEAFGYTRESGGLAVFHCPMARGGEGADWLQPSGATLTNPYFGAKMLRCGDEVRPLARDR